MCDGTALEQCGPTCALANLIVGDDVMFVRDWAGEPAGFALFDIAGGMAFGMRPSLTVSVKPAETVKVFGGEFAGNLSGWTLDGGKMGNARMIKRADGIYLSVGGGTVFLLR